MPKIVCVLVCLLSIPFAGATSQDAPQQPDFDSAVARGVAALLAMQEGDDNAEWPYEGVYRVDRSIPIGYRVGGTAIVVMALVNAHDGELPEDVHEAVARGVQFICASVDHPQMTHAFESRYDVRGWGYSYGLMCLVHLKRKSIIPDELAEQADVAVSFFLDGLVATEIPEVGGWNYSRPGGFQAPARPSPFMTAPTLQALFAAKDAGLDVSDEMIMRGLDALERGRTPTGAFMYAGATGERSDESVPGSVGRMLIADSTLYLAGRTELRNVRAAIDAFLVHWEWPDQRRAQPGTHVRPYGVAPYYFYFAHHAAAQAIELLPEREQAEYRRRLHERIFSVRMEDGKWNDRVFARSASYGTAMVLLALRMPHEPMLPRWSAGEK